MTVAQDIGLRLANLTDWDIDLRPVEAVTGSDYHFRKQLSLERVGDALTLIATLLARHDEEVWQEYIRLELNGS